MITNNYVKQKIDGKGHLLVKGKLYTWNSVYRNYSSEDGWILCWKDLEIEKKEGEI